MGSFADFYRQTAPQFNRGFTLGGMALQEQRGIEDTGYDLSKMYRQFRTRALPQLVNREASKNTFFSGGARQRADQLREDVGVAGGEQLRNLRRMQENMARRRTLIPFGYDVGGGG